MAKANSSRKQVVKLQRDKPRGEGVRFEPGVCPNPAGRPKHARTRLSDQFFKDLHEDWQTHGMKALTDFRGKSPGDYVRVVAGLIPREMTVKVNELEELSDDELGRQLAYCLAQLAAADPDAGAGEGEAEGAEPAGGLPTLQ